MNADMTRQEVRFIRWDVPDKKQEDLTDEVRDGRRCRISKERGVFTGLGDAAVTLWKNGGNRMEYVMTMPDGTDGDVNTNGVVPKVVGTSACYNREWLIAILKNMTSDWVKLRVDDGTTIMVLMGEVGERDAAAMIAPRIETEVDL